MHSGPQLAQATVMKSTFIALVLLQWLPASDFPAPYDSEPDTSGPMPAQEAAERMQLPPGFHATVFAAEPDVQNPIALAWDARGRLWVAENYTYADSKKKLDLSLRDRILIFQDRDGDGKFDDRKVFHDELQILTSIEIGGGGVWVMCPPQLLFIPDRNRDDVPDGAAEVALDGFSISREYYHTFANGLRFGPDGWLYGRCGVASAGEIGLPGAPQEERIPLRGTIWRYHPRRKVVEALSSGTTNPWGHDWNEHGELFFVNTVNGHLWHDFAGAHFVRLSMVERNPHAYVFIDHHADHWHFDTASGWQKSRDGTANDFGGGHAHAGAMVYLGDNWPERYRGQLFTLNLHGRRVNQESLERSGSGYVGRHGPDLLVSSDKWFRGIELSYGPDGGVFVADWSDSGDCHEYTGVHRRSGRIYKISYGDRKPARPLDLGACTPGELVDLHKHPNEWFARKARLELVERKESGGDLGVVEAQLRDLFEKSSDVVVKLRSLWTLYCLNLLDDDFLCAQLEHADEHVRTWAIRWLSDTWPLDTVMSRRPCASVAAVSSGPRMKSHLSPADSLPQFVRRAATDSSGLVRLALASTLQRLPLTLRPQLAAALLARKEDAADHNLPLLIWYGLIPVADSDPAALVELAARSELPLPRTLIARRLAEEIEKQPGPLNDLLQIATAKPEPFQAEVLAGVAEGLQGWRQAKKPAAWELLSQRIAKSSNTVLRDRARNLSVVFGDGLALEAVKAIALDKEADLNARKAALKTLIDGNVQGLRAICEEGLNETFLNSIAARGLASFDDPAIGTNLVAAYRQFHPSERGQLVSVLVSRASFAHALLDAVGQGKLPRADISAFHARQIRSLNDPKLNEKLTRVWGDLRDASDGQRAAIAKWKAELTPAVLAKADKAQGRLAFNTVCSACHTLYGEGGKVGPDLTGGGRENLDYLLENIVDPNAVVPADYRMSVFELKDGRVLNGLVADRAQRTLTIRTMTESLTIESSEIACTSQSSLSLMPEGLLDGLTRENAQALIAYLMHRSQVALPASTETKSKE